MKRLILIILFCITNFFLKGQEVCERIHIDQFGYRTTAKKVAVISNPKLGFNSNESFIPGESYEVRRVNDNETVYAGKTKSWKNGQIHQQSGDCVWWFDFSGLTSPGSYYIYDSENDVKSYNFKIDDDVYNNLLANALRVFFYQRCGFRKEFGYTNPGYSDNACHVAYNQDKNCRLVTEQNNAALEMDLSGGWHDAGDYNKYITYAYMAVHNLLTAYELNPGVFKDNYNIPESGNGIPDIIDEIKWELDWFLKMQNEDGSVLSKVSALNYDDASPPSTDRGTRCYGEASASATRAFTSVLAHAVVIFRSLNDERLVEYANKLLAASEKSWLWLENNPEITSYYENEGFQNASSNPVKDSYWQYSAQTGAAVYLFSATGKEKYYQYVLDNYKNIRGIKDKVWSKNEINFQDALLHFSNLSEVPLDIKNEILSCCNYAINNNPGLMPAISSKLSAYRSYMDDYDWGSNRENCNTGTLFYNMVDYKIDELKRQSYLNAAEDYLHYIHGVNPLGLVYMTNMDNLGAEKSCNEVYHAWFADGTKYDNAKSSTYGPIPAIITGGANRKFGTYTWNPYYSILSPPKNQPWLKSYLDWNTPEEHSYEVTENSNEYQSAYIKLLSKFVSENQVYIQTSVNKIALPEDVKIYPNPSKGLINIRFPDILLHPKTICIYNLDGREIMQFYIKPSKKSFINIASLKPGIYVLKIKDNENTYCKKIEIIE